MNKPTIELKKVKFGAAHSHQETINFVADVFINNECVGYAENQGCGGSTSVRANHPYDINQHIICTADDYFRSLPKKYNEEFKMEFGTSLEDEVDNIIGDLFNQKELDKLMKRLTKKTSNHLILLNPEKDRTIEVKYNKTIEDYLSNPKGREIILRQVEKLKVDYPTWTLLNNIK